MFMCRGYEATDSNVHALCCAMYAYGDIQQAIAERDEQLCRTLVGLQAMDHQTSSHVHVFGEMLKYYVDDKFARADLLSNLRKDDLNYTADVLTEMTAQADFLNRISAVGYDNAVEERGPVEMKDAMARRMLFVKNRNDATDIKDETKLMKHAKTFSAVLSDLSNDAGFTASAAISRELVVA